MHKTASTEVQSLMTLLFSKRDLESEESLKKFWQGITDLSGGYFRGIELKEAQFQVDSISRGTRSKASFKRAAHLREFQWASLSEAQFQGAIF